MLGLIGEIVQGFVIGDITEQETDSVLKAESAFSEDKVFAKAMICPTQSILLPLMDAYMLWDIL